MKRPIAGEPHAFRGSRHELSRSRASLAFNFWAVTHSGAPKGIGTLPVGFLALASEVMTEAGNEVRGKTHTG